MLLTLNYLCSTNVPLTQRQAKQLYVNAVHACQGPLAPVRQQAVGDAGEIVGDVVAGMAAESFIVTQGLHLRFTFGHYCLSID